VVARAVVAGRGGETRLVRNGETLAVIDSVPAGEVDGSEERKIVLKMPV
jgi:hypothetical protein